MHGLPVCPAAVGGNATVARVLVEHGADVNRRDSEGKTVMMVSLSEWHRRLEEQICISSMLLMLYYT